MVASVDGAMLNSSAMIFLCFVGCLSTSWIISILRFRNRPLRHALEPAMLIWPLNSKSGALPRPSSISPPTTIAEPLIPCQSTALFWQSQARATNHIMVTILLFTNYHYSCHCCVFGIYPWVRQWNKLSSKLNTYLIYMYMCKRTSCINKATHDYRKSSKFHVPVRTPASDCMKHYTNLPAIVLEKCLLKVTTS